MGRDSDDELTIYAKTIYAEARGEPPEGQKWVAWVIKNRANKPNWGGRSIRDICLQPAQFQCWNGKDDISINEPDAYRKIQSWVGDVYHAKMSQDPTGGCDHYNNPKDDNGGIEPEWVKNCRVIRRIGKHVFYKAN